jgi:hypothetical protein
MENTTTTPDAEQPRFIDITPTWSAALCGLIRAAGAGDPSATANLVRLAKFADDAPANKANVDLAMNALIRQRDQYKAAAESLGECVLLNGKYRGQRLDGTYLPTFGPEGRFNTEELCALEEARVLGCIIPGLPCTFSDEHRITEQQRRQDDCPRPDAYTRAKR